MKLRSENSPISGLLFVFTLIGLMLTACMQSTATPQSNLSTIDRNNQSDQAISASAEVVPKRWVQLAFLSGGVVKDVAVLPGDKVKPGDTLISLQDTSLRAAVEQARSALLTAKFTLESLKSQPTSDTVAAAEANLANAKVNLDRLERSGARVIEIDAAKAAVRSAQLSLDKLLAGPSADQISLAESNVKSADAALSQAEAALTQAQLRTPLEGQVIEVNLHAGEVASPGLVAVLLADLSTFRIETTDLSEIDVTRIQVGNPVSITFDAFPNLALQGAVADIALKANPGANVTYKVIIDLPDAPQTLRWGMTAFIKIDTK